MRYYLIAGEKSGDIQGSYLMQAIQKEDERAIFRCWGGAAMQQAGGSLVVNYSQLAFMGLDFLGSLIKVYRYLKYCQQDILAFQPDVVILIDYPAFNLRIARFAQKKGLQTFYYIAPKIWAWNTQRIKKIKAYVNRMFVVLPFEQAFYKEYNYAVDYVGNPWIEQVQQHSINPDFRSLHQLDPRPIIALLPGSRLQEIKRVLPTMLTITSSLPEYQFVVAALSELPSQVYEQASKNPAIKIIYDQPYDLLAHAHAAVVTSGTATLETAYFQVPQVVVYKTSMLTYILAKSLAKVKHISLINIIADDEIVPELIQYQYTATSLLQTLQPLLANTLVRKKQLSGYLVIEKLLGKQPASQVAAQLMLRYLKRTKQPY